MNTGWSSGPKTYLFHSALISAAPRIPGLEDDAPFPRLQPAAETCRWGFFAAISRVALCAVKFSTLSVLNLGRPKFVRLAYEFSTLGVRI